MSSLEFFRAVCGAAGGGVTSLAEGHAEVDPQGNVTQAWWFGQWLWGIAREGESLDDALTRLLRDAAKRGNPPVFLVNDDATFRIHLRHEPPEEIWVFGAEDLADATFRRIMDRLFHRPDELRPEVWIGGRRYPEIQKPAP